MSIDRNTIIQVTGITPVFKRKNFQLAAVEENGTYFYGMEDFPEIFKTFSKDEIEYARKETLILKDGEQLHLSNNKHFAKYARALMYENIAVRQKEISPDKHKMLLTNVYAEAAEEVQEIDAVSKALDYVRNKLTPLNSKQLYLYIGRTNWDSIPEVMRDRNIKLTARDHPQKIIDFFEKEGEIRNEVLARELIYDGVISETSKGYEYNKNLLSTSLQGLIERLSSDNKLREAILVASSEGHKDKPMSAEDRKKDSREEVLELKLEYITLSGGESYRGIETVSELKEAIAKKKEELKTKGSKDVLEKNKQAFRDKFADASIGKLRQSASSSSSCPKEEWDSIKDQKEMYEYLYNKKFGE